MDREEVIGLAKAESSLLGLWSKSFFRPTVELTGELRSGIFVSDLQQLLSACDDTEIVSAINVLE